MKRILQSTVRRAENKNKRRLLKEKVNHFSRVKDDPDRSKTQYIHGKNPNIYFDTETFEYYSDPSNPKELPKIIPYFIGACTNEPDSYVEFFGVDAAIQFLDWLYTNYAKSGSNYNLCAFNIDYDFQAIRPFIEDLYFDRLEIHYEMTDNKKFIFGGIKNRIGTTVFNMRLVDLWRWDTTKSLAKYMKHIVAMTYEDDGTVRHKQTPEGTKPDDTAARLDQEMRRWGFNKDSFKKLEIDYLKVNLHLNEFGEWCYFRSKEDWINNTNAIKLDFEAEQKYLKVDVTSLHLVRLEQVLMRELAYETLGLKSRLDHDCSITAPGFAKYLCEEFERKYMTETYRVGVAEDTYNHMVASYTGAFVCGNSDITYLDEETFRTMYPNESFYDDKGLPKIKSYDVNSMYPWAMHRGLPYGPVFNAKPGSGAYITWCEIEFTDYIDEHNEDPERRLYKWKPQYAYLNNSFFGRMFRIGIVPGAAISTRVFVLKELYELFISMCDVKCRVVKERYQRISTELQPFIEHLYTIKRNDDGFYPKSTVALIKLMLNSLYGKMAEQFKQKKIMWATDLDTLIHNNSKLVTQLGELGIEVITPEVTKKASFKHKVSPYVDLERRCGYFILENETKRYDRYGGEMRESITAGIYITAISRWYLLSTVKGEIDQGNIVLYCDTDSIKLIERRPPKFTCHDKELGAWKYEGSFTHFGHPNKLKKYFMHNVHTGQWMVKTSGVTSSYLRNPEGKFDLETIKTCYDPNNRILVRKCKPNNQKNSWWQTVIRRVDFKFIYEIGDDEPPTHIMDRGILKPYG